LVEDSRDFSIEFEEAVVGVLIQVVNCYDDEVHKVVEFYDLCVKDIADEPQKLIIVSTSTVYGHAYKASFDCTFLEIVRLLIVYNIFPHFYGLDKVLGQIFLQAVVVIEKVQKMI